MRDANETTLQRIMAAGLRIGSIKVNNVVLQDIDVAGAADVVNLQELVSNTLKLTRRRRNSKDGTRYPEPLLSGSSAHKLSIEIRDYLGYGDTRGLANSTRYASKRALDRPIGVERVMGIEPTLAAWEAAVLPLNYTRLRTSLCGHKKTGPFDPVSSNTTETRKQTRSPRRPRRDQNPLPICANTVALLPPSWPTVTLAPRLASRPNSLVRAPNSKVP